MRIAKEIAATIREKNGGLKSVKAKGFLLAGKKGAQVSMNLTDFNATSMWAAFNAAKSEAEKRGVEIRESELIGLVPLEVVTPVAAEALKIPGLGVHPILETSLLGED